MTVQQFLYLKSLVFTHAISLGDFERIRTNPETAVGVLEKNLFAEFKKRGMAAGVSVAEVGAKKTALN